MRRPLLLSGMVIALSALVLPVPALASAPSEAAQVRAQLAGVRLPFIANEGQVDARVAYYAPTFAGTLFVTQQGEIVYVLVGPRTDAKRDRGRPSSNPGWSLTETLRGGRARPVAQDRSAAGVSSFLGNDPARWRAALPTWEQVSLGEVWPGVTVVLRARGRSMEKVFTVHPGGAVARIRVGVAGAHTLTVDAEGALVAGTGLGAVTFTAPVAYQERDGVRRPVTAAYRPQGFEYGFSVGAYDPGLPLVIDPLLQSTYLGGSGFDEAFALAIHPTTGDIYVAGNTTSSNFPGTTSGGTLPGTAAFVARLPSTLTSLTHATYFALSEVTSASALAIHPTTGDIYVAGGLKVGVAAGAGFVARLPSTLTSVFGSHQFAGSATGPPHTLPLALAIDPTTGDVYVAGVTDASSSFPGTAGGAQPTFGGGSDDAFVARLPSTLTSFKQATYLGGSGGDSASALAIDPTTGDVYVAGETRSSNFPGTAGGAQPAIGGGADAFVARLPSTLTPPTQPTYASYLGGSGGDSANALAIHPTTGDVYVAGVTDSGNFPGTAGGAQPAIGGGADAFVARLPSTLTPPTQAPHATYLGDSGSEDARALAIHPTTGDVYVAGVTDSGNFPGTAGGAQPAIGGGGDAFVARLPSTLTSPTQATYATYLGGSGGDSANALAIHPMSGDVYVAGITTSSPFPRTGEGAQPAFGGGVDDAFVVRLTFDLALGPALFVTPLSLNFGPVIVNTTTDLTFTVRNTADGTLTGTAAASGGPFSVVAGSPFSLGAGASQAVTVRFSPTAGNTFSGNVNFTSNAGPLSRSVTGQGQTFADVPVNHLFWTWIEALFAAGITGGCATSPLQYCPEQSVTRGQMAVFLLRGIFGAGYDPPAATGTMFTDVPITHPFAEWIEQLAREGITAGCSTSPPQYCPDQGVTRDQMAVFILRAEHGAGYEPPAATGTMFTDVPITHPFAKWIEQLAREGITAGCGATTYCPDGLVTRGQMAVFLVRAFNLPH